jgi:transcriptional regulator with GAF, ATPase, and Fis domain
MLMGRATDGSDGWTLVYLPFVSAILLVMSLAGVECTLYVQRVTAERRYNSVKREEDELHAVERQRAFNYIWQELADNHSSTTVPAPVLTELATIFSADLVAVWSGDKAGGFRLDGAHPLAAEGAVRLDKVAHMSPCFERIRATQRLVRVTDFERDTTKAFAWFCEENGLKHVILCPVLVRHDLVGVLAFFYRDKRSLPAKVLEEMQSAANLFLCAL